LKPAQANSSQDPLQKRASGVAQGVGPEFKLQCYKKKKKKKETMQNSIVVIWKREKLVQRPCLRRKLGMLERED
jgi:hypothetical protein